MLSKRHPRLKGQPMTKKSSLSSDDDILRCAITVKERVNIVVSNSIDFLLYLFIYEYFVSNMPFIKCPIFGMYITLYSYKIN